MGWCRLLACAVLVGVLASGTAAAQTSPYLGVSTGRTPAQAADAVREVVGAFSRQAIDLEGELDRAPGTSTTAPALSDEEVLAIAATSERVRDWIADHPVTRTTPEWNASERKHTVWYVAKDADGTERTEAQVFVQDDTGQITEVRTGPQVAWMMARGYSGAFGRAVTRPEVWIPLCLLFLVPLVRVRRIVSLRTLDLLVLLSFSISLIWFNRGQIFTSVPLAYPPMLYLVVRLGLVGLTRMRRAPVAAEDVAVAEPRAPSFRGWAPTWVLVTALALALGLRFGLNAFDANVIDVGYAGVIGADRITHGQTPYGTFPDDCGRCDTYGPLNYIAYVPFELAQPWTGHWDSLPAAHGAAVTFDLLCIAGMLVLGWQLGGLRLGMALALGWAAFPFTAYSLESNANDSLVAAALVWGLVAAGRPVLRGLTLGLAIATKFGPAILLPLWARSPFPRPRRADRGLRGVLRVGGGLLLAVVAVGWVLLLDGDDGVRSFWSRTVSYQFGRESPFSVWGQYPGLRPVQLALTALVALAAVGMLRWPRRLDLMSTACLSGALVVATQLTLTHWFYLYIPWFLPFALLAFVPEWPAPLPRPRTDPGHAPLDDALPSGVGDQPVTA